MTRCRMRHTGSGSVTPRSGGKMVAETTKGSAAPTANPLSLGGCAGLRCRESYWLNPNFPFEFFHSARRGMGSMVSQCSAIFPL